MASLPFKFQKIKTKEYNQIGGNSIEKTSYLVTVLEKNSYFDKTVNCSRDELIRLRDDLNRILEDTNTAELLLTSVEKALIIDKAHNSDKLCENCSFKMSLACKTCLFDLQSPLERKLFIELKKANIYFKPQYALNWYGKQISIEGKKFDDPINNFKEVLTVVDFLIEKNGVRLCIYTDGHTYHERTEEQAQRDRNIDRKLQELGFKVLRYTGKEVNEEIQKIIVDIEKWTSFQK